MIIEVWSSKIRDEVIDMDADSPRNFEDRQEEEIASDFHEFKQAIQKHSSLKSDIRAILDSYANRSIYRSMVLELKHDLLNLFEESAAGLFLYNSLVQGSTRFLETAVAEGDLSRDQVRESYDFVKTCVGKYGSYFRRAFRTKENPDDWQWISIERTYPSPENPFIACEIEKTNKDNISLKMSPSSTLPLIMGIIKELKRISGEILAEDINLDILDSISEEAETLKEKIETEKVDSQETRK